ncbi:neurotactin [Tribolium madens]|uniref:neurotactin n=1 Tax=Tribolium madens TaxID=41895 RepID=UPI001CF72C1B|nr:neurotactin [Tribolium madens]
MSDKIEENTEKSDDKKDIEMEEREKMLNAENKALEKVEESVDDKKPKTENKEGMEVKPKKIPIGGIQMPGFFTRSKSKEKCKDEDQEVEGTELIETRATSEEAPSQTRIKLPNPFRKSKAGEEDGEKSSEQKEKKKLLDTIRLPLVSVFPRKKKEEQKLESQTAQAGLASMETLDDKSTDGKSNDEMKNVNLDEKKDLEAQEVAEEATWRQKLKTYRVAIGALLVFLLLTLIIVIVAIPGKDIPRVAPIKDGRYVEAVTGCGKVEGLVEDSAVAFRGIPYARPPIGNLRFKYAQPLNNIDYCWNGTFLAHNATETCLQIYSNGSISGTEDCLTLDVITPYVRYHDPLPVIVLIGAESFIGGSPGKLRPSARYARSKDVVFVRPNFRLGALGFLALDILSNADYPPTSGNYGLSDIIEALKWVQLNIRHFGGDNSSVTLLGHRAGATLVTALATLPDAKKYFSKAWAASGGALYPNKTRREAEIDNRSYLQYVDCQDIDCLLKLDAEKIVRSVQDTWRKPPPDLPTAEEDPSKRHYWLVLDGQILKDHPATTWTQNKLKLVIGTTAHAGASETLLLKHKEWTEFLVRKHLHESFLNSKNLTESVLEMYPRTYKGLSAMISDIRTVCPLMAIASQMHEVPFYVVTQTRGDQDVADVDSDIDAILGRYEPKTPEQKRYFSAMQGLFYHYVWSDRVEHKDVTKKILLVGQDVLPNATYSHCAFWINKGVVLPFAALD